LCEFNKNIYLSFAPATKVRVLCYYLLAQYVTVTTKFYRRKPCTACQC